MNKGIRKLIFIPMLNMNTLRGIIKVK